MKTNSEVDTAEINGSGKPVGGTKPVNTSYCIMNFELSQQCHQNNKHVLFLLTILF